MSDKYTPDQPIVNKANYLKAFGERIDWKFYTERVTALCQRLQVPHYIKKDLQPYLPPGYHNPLRVTQHH